MKLTPSQKTAIEKQKRIFRLVHPSATFLTRTLPMGNGYIIRLTSLFTIPTVTGGMIEKTKSWTIGIKGGVTE